jgi:hypothetical protein
MEKNENQISQCQEKKLTFNFNTLSNDLLEDENFENEPLEKMIENLIIGAFNINTMKSFKSFTSTRENYEKRKKYFMENIDTFNSLTVIELVIQRMSNSLKEIINLYVMPFSHTKTIYYFMFPESETQPAKVINSKIKNVYCCTHCCRCNVRLPTEQVIKEEVERLIKLDGFVTLFNNMQKIYFLIKEGMSELDDFFSKHLSLIDNKPFKFEFLLKEQFITIIQSEHYWVKHAIEKLNSVLKVYKIQKLHNIQRFIQYICQPNQGELARLIIALNDKKNQTTIKEDNFKTVDELLNYINDETITKSNTNTNLSNNDKSGKKRKKKKATREPLDKDVEDFKNFLRINSVSSKDIIKLPSNITKEWINKIKI